MQTAFLQRSAPTSGGPPPAARLALDDHRQPPPPALPGDRLAAEVPLEQALVAAPQRARSTISQALGELPLVHALAHAARVAGSPRRDRAASSVSVNSVRMALPRATVSRELLSTSSRGAVRSCPASGHPLATSERFAPLRVGGVVAVAAPRRCGAGAESAAPPGVGERHLPPSPQVRATGPAAPTSRCRGSFGGGGHDGARSLRRGKDPRCRVPRRARSRAGREASRFRRRPAAPARSCGPSPFRRPSPQLVVPSPSPLPVPVPPCWCQLRRQRPRRFPRLP